jgi:N-acetylglutamate synthase
MKIRTFEQTDYLNARALWERTEGVGLSAADEPEAIGTFLARNPSLSFVATIDEQIIGTILCGHDGRRGLIHHLVTAQSHRRRGIGTALLRHGLQALRRDGIDKCHLLVFRSNEAGLAFWRKVGAEERVSIALFSMLTNNGG